MFSVRELLRAVGPLPADPRVLCLGSDAIAEMLPEFGAQVDTAATGIAYDMVCGVGAGREHRELLAPGGVVARADRDGLTAIRRDDDEALRRRLAVPGCTRAAAYPPRWLLANEMGPNPLWLTEALTSVVELTPGMRVLDLGCGNALTSVFLAREFGVTVWAADLWIDPGPNWARIRAAGVDDMVFPIKAEAHALPFADGFFDAILSVDSYEYFGSDDRYIAVLSRFVRPGGQIGVAQPITFVEMHGETPEHLRDVWNWEFHTWHTSEWWRRHWAKTGTMDVEVAEQIPDSARIWRDWEDITVAECGADPAMGAAIAVDAGRTFGFGRLVGRRRG